MYDEIADNIYAEPMRKDLPQKQTIREAEQILHDPFKRLERPQFILLIHNSPSYFQRACIHYNSKKVKLKPFEPDKVIAAVIPSS